jgi:hypothetical protein
MPKTPFPTLPSHNRFLQLVSRLTSSTGATRGMAPAMAAGAQARPLSMAQLLLAVVVSLLVSSVATAFTAPAAGDFGYDVYDIVVNQILNGPIGFIGGLFLIVFGATQIMKNWVMTILCIIAGTVLIRAEALVVTLGDLVR